MAGTAEEQPAGRSIFLDVCVRFAIFLVPKRSLILNQSLFFSSRFFAEQIKPVSGLISTMKISAKSR